FSGCIRIVNDIYLVEEIMDGRRFRKSFLNLLFEPIRRVTSQYIGLEVRGVHQTVAADAGDFLKGLWEFGQTTRPTKRLILFADTEREDHLVFSEFEKTVLAQTGREAMRFFEDREACIKFVREAQQ